MAAKNAAFACVTFGGLPRPLGKTRNTASTVLTTKKQDSQQRIWHLLIYPVPLTPVLVIFVFDHRKYLPSLNKYSTSSTIPKSFYIVSFIYDYFKSNSVHFM